MCEQYAIDIVISMSCDNGTIYHMLPVSVGQLQGFHPFEDVGVQLSFGILVDD